MQRQRRSPSKLQRPGAVSVEMAICLPILFMMLFSAVDFARLNMLRNSAEQAAYQGARRAIVPGATAAQAKSAARKVLKAVGAVNTTVTVAPTEITSDTREIAVTVQIPLSSNAWLASAANTNRKLIKTCKMSRERTRLAP